MWNRVLYLTTDSRNGPVSLNIRGPIGEFKGKRSCVWVQVPVERRDVEGIWLWLLAYLHLVRENLGCVVVDIQQEDLESACATCRWHTCTDRKVTYTQSAYTYLWENRFLKIYQYLMLHNKKFPSFKGKQGPNFVRRVLILTLSTSPRIPKQGKTLQDETAGMALHA